MHLMVISGSHISLLAGMLYGLVAALHRLGCWPRRLPWLPCACALGLLGAWSYGLMAGFEVPVRRACLMVSLALVWRLRFRHLGLLTRCWQRWCWSCWSSRWPACRRGSGCRSWRLPCCSGCSPGALGAGAGGRPGGGRSGDGAGAGDAAAGAGPAVEPERSAGQLLAVPWIELLVVPRPWRACCWVPGLGEGCFAPLAFRWTCCFVHLACWRAWPRPGSHPPQRPGA